MQVSTSHRLKLGLPFSFFASLATAGAPACQPTLLMNIHMDTVQECGDARSMAHTGLVNGIAYELMLLGGTA